MIEPRRRPALEWGPALWAYLHTLSVVDFAPGQGAAHAAACKRALAGLAQAVPCERCARALDRALQRLDAVDCCEPMAMFRWGWQLHNEVNVELGKPRVSYDVALAMWTRLVE